MIFRHNETMKIKWKRVLSVIGLLAVSFSLALGAFFISNNLVMGKADGRKDPCDPEEGDLELINFIEEGEKNLERIETNLQQAPEAQTSGTVNKIIVSGNGKASFYVSRIDPKSRIRSAIRVEGLPGSNLPSVGDYITFSARYTKQHQDYWAEATDSWTNHGLNLYGKVTPVAITSEFEMGKYEDGLYVSIPSRKIGNPLSRFSFPVTSDEGLLGFELGGAGNLPDYPLLIDGRSKEKTNAIYEKLDALPNNARVSFKGNIRSYRSKKYIAISDSSDFEVTTAEGGSKTAHFYAINDFHGSTEKMASLATALKEKDDGNAVFVNSGDLWQGSLTSNYNYGALLTECLKPAGFDSFTLGNHEFDWGIDYIKRNASLTEVPFLAANLYSYDMKTKTYGEFREDIVKEYTIKDLDNGLRVGVIGVIGQDQITSITSTFVENVGFKDPREVVPGISEKLRKEEGCDLVVLSAHAPQSAVQNEPIARSVDAVFCAHTHKEEKSTYNGVPYIQGGSYGAYISEVTIETEEGEVLSRNYSNTRFNPRQYTEDPTVKALVDKAEKESDAIGSEVLGALDGNLSSQGAMPHLVCEAIAKESEAQGYTIDMALTNQARQTLYAGTVTYESLFKTLPFNNVVYIAEAKGSDLIRQTGYGSFYRTREEAFNYDGTYVAAIIDYVLLHQSSNREYDYFSSGFKILGNLKMEGMPFYNYREVTAAHIRELGSIDSNFYSKNSSRWDPDSIKQAVHF